MIITRPLEQYRLEFKDKFREIAEHTFDALVSDSGVDIAANNTLCAEIDKLQDDADAIKRKLTNERILCTLLWIAVIGAIGYIIFGSPDTYIIIALIALSVVCLIALFVKVHPTIKRLKSERDDLQSQIDQQTNEAWAQMDPLNKLYDWGMFYRMFSKTIPDVVFDDFVPTARLSQLRSHGMMTELGNDTSVLYAHSGAICGNPFVLCRTRTFHWGTMTYTGSKTIHWSTRERGADGKYQTVHHSQTLTASIVEPYPEYPEITKLIYGHAAAPDLTFHRTKNMFDYKEGKLMYTLKKKRLERKSRKLSADYAMATNDEFEVLFTATDRSDNQQFFLLFTPLAQNGIIELIRDKTDAYGDDFEFIKSGEINYIISDHAQSMTLDLNPGYFKHYDFNKAKENFIRLNCEYFRAIYFSMAPILSIPLYQDTPNGYTTQPIKRSEMKSSSWEHEALANFWGESEFCHPSCETANILKTEYDGSSVVCVKAYGHASHPRVTYVKKYGGDGRWHNVPVHWREYYPVTGNGAFHIQEHPSDTATHTEHQEQSEIIYKMRHRGILRRNIWTATN